MARKSINKLCQTCGKEYSIRVDRADKSKYCSRPCKQVDSRDQESHICKNCGKSFSDKASQERMFCSKKCQYVHKHNHALIKAICIFCKNEFDILSFEAKTRIYCSDECWYSAMAGSGHPNWKGGYSRNYRYGDDWKKISHDIRKRDNWTCQVCGKFSKAHGRNAHVVHHIQKIRSFGDDLIRANDPTNLVTLCHVCHPKVECGKINLSLSSSSDSKQLF